MLLELLLYMYIVNLCIIGCKEFLTPCEGIFSAAFNQKHYTLNGIEVCPV
jgi:hypothetical protein